MTLYLCRDKIYETTDYLLMLLMEGGCELLIFLNHYTL